jgi:hypothetical protein
MMMMFYSYDDFLLLHVSVLISENVVLVGDGLSYTMYHRRDLLACSSIKHFDVIHEVSVLVNNSHLHGGGVIRCMSVQKQENLFYFSAMF